MKGFVYSACLLVLTTAIGEIQAEPVRVDFTGQLTNVLTPPGYTPHHTYGDAFFGHLYFDPTKMSSATDDGAGRKTFQFAPGDATLVLWINGETFFTEGLKAETVVDADESGKRSVSFAGLATDGVSLLGISFGEPTGPHILTDDLPSAADLITLGKAGFGALLFNIDMFGTPKAAHILTGEVGTVLEAPAGSDGGNPAPGTSETPEPASALLLVLGTAGIVTRRALRRKQ